MVANPDTRNRTGREWSRNHYQNHAQNRERFVKEKIDVLEELMRGDPSLHLILAGSPKMVGRMQKALPPLLRSRLLSTINRNPAAGIDPILQQAIQAFAEAEHQESRANVATFTEAIMKGGLAVAGSDACLNALGRQAVDVLLIDQDYEDDEIREELIRLAIQAEVQVETVRGDTELQRMGGAGCLLRYRLPESVPVLAMPA